MSTLETRLSSLEASIAARMSALDSRIAARLGSIGGSSAAPLSESPSAAGVSRGGVRYGLFFGVGMYDPHVWGNKQCPWFVDNVKNLRDVCVRLGGWRSEDVRIVADGDATVLGVRRAMADMAERAVAGDFVLLCFSTHGGRKPGGGEDDSFLVAYDGGYLESMLRQDLLRFRKGVRLVVVLQACHSAALFEKSGQGLLSAFEGGDLDRFRSAFAEAASLAPGRISERDIGWIASAAPDQTSISGDGGSLMLTDTLVREAWCAGAADGFAQAVVDHNGPSSVESSDAILKVGRIGLPNKTGRVSFLDLAAYCTWKWRDIYYQFQNSDGSPSGSPLHIPCFANADALRFPAGRTEKPAMGGRSESSSLHGGIRSLVGPTRYGLFVGINEYGVYPDGFRPGSLSGCVADAENFRRACWELGGWRDLDCTVLLDRDATVAGIRAALAGLAERARPGDIVLYCHSGHGGDIEGGPVDCDAYLCAYDDRYFEPQFWSDIARFRAGVKFVAVVDACHSGGFIDKGSVGWAERAEAKLRAVRPAAGGGISGSEVGIVTAAAGNQVSLDGGEAGGLFASKTFVAEGWRGGAADGYTSAVLAVGGPEALAGADAVAALPGIGVPHPTGTVTFLDLALYSSRVWSDRYSGGARQHIPQFHNPSLLASIVAGRTGVSAP